MASRGKSGKDYVEKKGWGTGVGKFFGDFAKRAADNPVSRAASAGALGRALAGSSTKTKSAKPSMDMPDSAYAAGSRKAMMDAKTGSKGETYKAPKAAAKPSVGSWKTTVKPAKSEAKSDDYGSRRAELGDFYLNATSGMFSTKAGGKKKK